MPDYKILGKIVVDALKQKNAICIYRHIDGLSVSAKFSGVRRRFRYKLEAVNDKVNEGKTVCAIMQNPSYADEDIADKSVNFLERLIFGGYVPVFNQVKRLIVVNQFAFVQTEDFKGVPSKIGAENNRYIESAIAESDIVLIAWGASNKYNDRILLIYNILKKHLDKKLYKTSKHPSLGSLTKDFITKHTIKT